MCQVGGGESSVLVKAWNLSTWPAYKSRVGWNKQGGQGPSQGQAAQLGQAQQSKSGGGGGGGGAGVRRV